MYLCVGMCVVCVCVCVWEREIHYMRVCVCVWDIYIIYGYGTRHDVSDAMIAVCDHNEQRWMTEVLEKVFAS